MEEELAVGAQVELPYIHIVANKSHRGLIRRAQRALGVDCCVPLG